jgi:iron complex transport system ATP-binding protein
MLVLDGISFSFSFGSAEILKNICFELHSGDLVTLLGVNGSGKSTLLRTINGILKPHKGTILIDNIPATSLNGREIAQKIGYMPQKTNGVACTVFDAVLLGRKPHFRWNNAPADLEIVERVLEMLGMERLALRDQEPQVLLLDEPINHLDIKNQLETMSLLKEITREMKLVTMTVLHDLSAALRFSDRFVLLRDGKLYACGNRNVMSETAMQEVFGMRAAIREVDGIPVVLPLSPC